MTNYREQQLLLTRGVTNLGWMG